MVARVAGAIVAPARRRRDATAAETVATPSASGGAIGAACRRPARAAAT